jgi:tRNA threonylcarbamoyladenosine biosynthesis protein TsaB
MRVLAFDTALAACSAALLDGARVLASRKQVMGRGQAEALMPLLRDVMAEGGCAFAALDLLAVTVGPGTFTGLRTGIAAAKGLALATGKPLVGVTTLEAIAETAKSSTGGLPCLAVVDAHRGEVYVQLFGPAGERTAPQALSPERAAALIADGPVTMAGSGATLVAPHLRGRGVLLPVEPDPDPVAIARLAGARWSAGRQALSVEPLYLREPDAKPGP